MSGEISAAYSYYDIKENTRYLVYLAKANSETRLGVTNGASVWSAVLNETLVIKQTVSRLDSLDEFTASLSQALEADKFELNKVTDTKGDELVELKSNCSGIILTIMAEESKSSSNEIKFLLFGLFDKLKKLDGVNVRPQVASVGKSESTSAGDALKKFNVAPSSQIKNRKAGMSIVNPLSKRKKLPQGVKFDDDAGNEYESDDGSTSSSSGSRPSCKK